MGDANKSYGAQGDMDIGGVVAPVILAMVGLNFVRTAPWEAMFCLIWPILFVYQVKNPTIPNLQSFSIFLRQFHFDCSPLYRTSRHNIVSPETDDALRREELEDN
jgi:hypothetical protein